MKISPTEIQSIVKSGTDVTLLMTNRFHKLMHEDPIKNRGQHLIDITTYLRGQDEHKIKTSAWFVNTFLTRFDEFVNNAPTRRFMKSQPWFNKLMKELPENRESFIKELNHLQGIIQLLKDKEIRDPLTGKVFTSLDEFTEHLTEVFQKEYNDEKLASKIEKLRKKDKNSILRVLHNKKKEMNEKLRSSNINVSIDWVARLIKDINTIDSKLFARLWGNEDIKNISTFKAKEALIIEERETIASQKANWEELREMQEKNKFTDKLVSRFGDVQTADELKSQIHDPETKPNIDEVVKIFDKVIAKLRSPAHQRDLQEKALYALSKMFDERIEEEQKEEIHIYRELIEVLTDRTKEMTEVIDEAMMETANLLENSGKAIIDYYDTIFKKMKLLLAGLKGGIFDTLTYQMNIIAARDDIEPIQLDNTRKISRLEEENNNKKDEAIKFASKKGLAEKEEDAAKNIDNPHQAIDFILEQNKKFGFLANQNDIDTIIRLRQEITENNDRINQLKIKNNKTESNAKNDIKSNTSSLKNELEKLKEIIETSKTFLKEITHFEQEAVTE